MSRRISEQNITPPTQRELSEARNILLARSRLALLYARRGQISQPMIDAMGVVLDEKSGEIW